MFQVPVSLNLNLIRVGWTLYREAEELIVTLRNAWETGPGINAIDSSGLEDCEQLFSCVEDGGVEAYALGDSAESYFHCIS